MSKYTKTELASILSIGADRITVSNGNSKYAAIAKIRDEIGNVIFSTGSVWHGVVSINKNDILKLKNI